MVPEAKSNLELGSTSEELRSALIAAAHLLAASGSMSSTGHLNFSARLNDQQVLLTSTGTIDGLTADDIAVLRFDGSVESGRLGKSTREIVGMHMVVYQARPDANAVLHTHSPHLVAFALAHRPLPCRYEPLLRHGQSSAVPVVRWAPRGSEPSVRGIADALEKNSTTRAVLLANHGVLAFAASPRAAAKLVITMEEAARAEIQAAALGGARDLPPGGFKAVRASMERVPT